MTGRRGYLRVPEDDGETGYLGVPKDDGETGYPGVSEDDGETSCTRLVLLDTRACEGSLRASSRRGGCAGSACLGGCTGGHRGVCHRAEIAERRGCDGRL